MPYLFLDRIIPIFDKPLQTRQKSKSISHTSLVSEVSDLDESIDRVLCDVTTEAEEIVNHRSYTVEYTNQAAPLRRTELTFLFWCKNMVVCPMTGTWLVFQ